MKLKIIILCLAFFSAGAVQAQWVVSDPSNFAQSIVNSTNQMVHTSTTAANMLNNFQETIKIYEQGRKYYDSLKAVSNLVRNARKVQRCILMVGEISDIYVNGYGRMLHDDNFSPKELSSIAVGYTRIIEESAASLKELQDIVNPTNLSLTDKDRFDVVDRVYDVLLKSRNLARYFTRKNIAVSLQRSRGRDDAQRVLTLYGSADDKYW